ncbi:MAG: GGDEF domain-containing protein [Bacillota bacterium]
MNNCKLYKFLNNQNNKYNNDPELIKMLLDYKGKEGHERIQKKLFKELITKYVNLSKELDEKIELITKISQTDQLTQIYNRVKFNEELEKEIRKHQKHLSIIMFDIDHFKKVNDNYGHDIGDRVLIRLTNVVNELIRKNDTFARWGGEEFMILNPETNIEDAYDLAEKVRKKIKNTKIEKVGNITCSFGVTEYKIEDEFDSFTKRVDEALYQAKENGRDRVVKKYN